MRIGSTGVFAVSSWNIDDVTITNNVSDEVAACLPPT